jgi:hypothetical protein
VHRLRGVILREGLDLTPNHMSVYRSIFEISRRVCSRTGDERRAFAARRPESRDEALRIYGETLLKYKYNCLVI